MVNTSTRPITVDGVRLDTLAWNIEKIERATAQRRSGDYDVPNLDGAVASLNDALEPATFGLQMWLRGTDADGAVTAQGMTSELRDNLDELLHMFGKRHALLDVRESVGGLTENITNLHTNPQAGVSFSGSSYYAGIGGVAAMSYVSDGSGPRGASGGGFTRITWSTAATGSGGAKTFAALGSMLPTTAGVAQSYTVWVRTSRAIRLTSTGERWTAPGGGSQIGGITGGTATTTTTVPNTWTPFTFTWTPANSGEYWCPTVYATTGAGFWNAGDTMDITDWTITATTSPVDFFCGDSVSTPDVQYAWTGTPNASTSTRTSRPYRRCWAKVLDSIVPELNLPGSAGTFSVALTIPAGMWEDPDYQDWTKTAPVTAAEVTTLNGSTERINDAVFLVQGPVTTPRITDPATGMWVELGSPLGAGVYWRFNSQTWASRTTTTLTLGSEDTTGTDQSGVTTVGGPSRAYGLPLVPVRDTGGRRVRVTLTGASGIVAGTTALSVRARRKYGA